MVLESIAWLYEALVVVLLGMFVFSVANAALYYSYFWQLKEYRLDRMRDFLSTESGRKKMFWPFGVVKIAFMLVALSCYAWLYWGMDAVSIIPAGFVIFLGIGLVYVSLWILEIIDFVWRLVKRKIYRPTFTVKAALIFLLSFAVPVGAGLFVRWMMGEAYSLRTVLMFLVPFLGVISSAAIVFQFILILLFSPITAMAKRIALYRAHGKITKMAELKVIGITGSYGKSSVKEILAQVLEGKFRVLKTPGNTNTEIGVAGIVLKKLRAEHEVFIVECGAYKIGEIRKIVAMVQPKIGIITAVKDSHLAMFGSLENVKKAKFELVENMSGDGIAFFNGDNDGSMELAGWARRSGVGKVVTYGTGKGRGLEATDIVEDIEGIKFKVEGVEFSAGIPGRHNVSNILAAVGAAKELGMDLKEIAERVKGVKLREHTLSVVKPREDLVILDDTYNANPDGVVAGLNYLGLYKDWQKIVVFPGMLELGERSEPEHRRVGEKVAEICDFAYLTSRDFEKPLMASFGEKKFEKYKFVVDNQVELLSDLQSRISGKKSVILLISRGSEVILKKLNNAL